MALRTDNEKLKAAWRALAGNAGGDGWRTIPLDTKGNCRLQAGRHFPGDKEAVLVGFRSISMPDEKYLPQGYGFRVDKLEHNVLGGTHTWVSLARLPAGSIDMFAMMAEDIINILDSHAGDSEDSIFQLFLGRIRAWQNFMDSNSDGKLSTEAEVGLFGELIILKKIIDSHLPPLAAVESWHGPLRGLQDFLLGTGGIEVKTSVAQGTFPAKINSLEQLDNSLIQPLYLAGVRLSQIPSGVTLPELANEVRISLTADGNAQGLFDSRLIQAGLLDAFTDHYTRRFKYIDTVTFLIADDFPRLVRGNISLEIRDVKYEIVLEMIKKADFGLDKAITELRGI